VKKILAALFVLAVVLLACGQPAPEWQLRGWTVTPSPFEPTQTPVVVQITTTPPLTYTPIVKVVTETPRPTEKMCVDALVAVHLRPSPNESGYPIMVLVNGAVVEDLGGRSGEWIFVRYIEAQGWVFEEYLSACNNTE
jgi:hypothetical protein